MKQANSLTVHTHLLVQTFLIVACIYVVINFLLSQLAYWLERRSQRRPHAAAATGAPSEDPLDTQVPTRQLVH
jgi:glutamate transport system permease protein